METISLVDQWRAVFFETVRQHKNARLLQEASQKGQLGKWTTALTEVVVSTCQALGWQASAKGHKLDLLPVTRHEYLSQDVVVGAGAKYRAVSSTLSLNGTRKQNDE